MQAAGVGLGIYLTRYSLGFDKFCPMGPCLVSARSLPDPHVVSLQTRLNGKLMQDGTAQKMIFPLAKSVFLFMPISCI